MLTTLGDKILLSSIKDGVLTLCHTMDLIALANNDNQVQVFRMNGEVVFSVPKKRPDAPVTQINWKPNGRLLAVGYSDGIVVLVNTYTGGIVQKIEPTPTEKSAIQHLGWGLSLNSPSIAKYRIQQTGKGITLDNLMDEGHQDFDIDLPPDLPVELATLEVEAMLPKISVLPALSRDEDLFSSRTSLDSLFHGTKKEDLESTDTLLIGFDKGRLLLNVYDTFSLGHLSSNDLSLKLVNHTSHPYSSTQVLLWESSDRSLYFQPIDICPITDAGRYLSLIASKTTQLQNLLRYLYLAQQQITNEFKNSQDLPKKFMRNVEESLQEKDHCSFVHAAYHLAATGHCFETMKEWLVDELGDRGQKRWEKATTTGYENVRQYTHENLIPALQRFSILMSRLRGFSKFQDSSIALGIETQELDSIFNTLNCLELLAHCVLIYTNGELQQFHAFAGWLKHEIEAQGIDPTSTTADEQLEKDVILDYPRILEYMHGPMLNSQLYELLDLQLDGNRTTWDLAQEGSVLYEHYKSELKKLKSGATLDKKLPGLQTLLSHLKDQCSKVFDKISLAQGRKIHLGDRFLLSRSIDHADVRILPEADFANSHRMSAYIARVNVSNPNKVCITKIIISILNGISSIESTSAATIALPSNTQVISLKFADNHHLAIILSDQSQSRVLFVPYDSTSPSTPSTLKYGPIPSPSDPGAVNDLNSESVLDSLSKHVFPSEQQPWRPGRMEINGRAGRRVVCIVSIDGNRYVLLDLDSGGDEDGDDSQDE